MINLFDLEPLSFLLLPKILGWWSGVGDGSGGGGGGWGDQI